MSTVDEIRAYYTNGFTSVPEPWDSERLSWKHYRIETLNGIFIKLNKARDRYDRIKRSPFRER